MKVFGFLLLYSWLVSVSLVQTPEKPHLKNNDYGILYYYNDSLQFETHPLSGGWGYRIYIRYKLIVNQPNIPALSGNQPFKTQTHARKIAELASSKITQGYLPPTLSIEEIENELNLRLK
ncbi:DUF4907 domain-containing protein [Emticicia sp. BO119]|uniref:DUF4907 domain-containing protein n=1 Tax=Emticicia sp. BO119 TaxID=2757768 RepID=UPI0015F026FE|nr:DUF4907 domain-containing protein [Emticicia sp. BO119]MBA4851449.1 DUF4907 domain-containing protein [Emticicia sp. BO119]